MSTILVVEDEAAIAELLSINLRHAGHTVSVAADGEAAQALIDAALPDLVLLDWMLPGAPGPELARRWRAAPRTRELPIIMLTARASETDLVRGLDAGADDYLTKPFSRDELLARMRALLRRKSPHALEDAVRLGSLMLEPATRRVTVAPSTAQGHSGDARLDASLDAIQEARLGPTEFRLLHFLMTHPERVHNRAQLLDQVWGDHVFIEERTVDVHIKRLREALAPVGAAAMVETVRGAGYRITASAPLEPLEG